MTVPLIRNPEDVCCHCRADIYFQGMWRHLSSLLSACDNGRTNAQPGDGSRRGSPTRPRMTDGCGPEHTYRGACEYAAEQSEDGAR